MIQVKDHINISSNLQQLVFTKYFNVVSFKLTQFQSQTHPKSPYKVHFFNYSKLNSEHTVINLSQIAF